MQVIYSHLAAEKCIKWSRAAKLNDSVVEIGWMQEIIIRDNRTLYIPDVHLFAKQTVHGAEFVATADMVAAFYDQWIADGKDPAVLLGWGHSHGTGEAFQSATDKKTSIDRFSRKKLCVASTWNIKGNVFIEINVFQPLHLVITSPSVEFSIEYPEIDVDVDIVKTVLQAPPKPEQHSIMTYDDYNHALTSGSLSKREMKRLKKQQQQYLDNGGSTLKVASREPQNGYDFVDFCGSYVEFGINGLKKMCDIATWFRDHDDQAFPTIPRPADTVPDPSSSLPARHTNGNGHQPTTSNILTDTASDTVEDAGDQTSISWVASTLSHFDNRRVRVCRSKGKSSAVFSYYIRSGMVFRGKPRDEAEKSWSFSPVTPSSVEIAHALRMFIDAERHKGGFIEVSSTGVKTDVQLSQM